MKRMFIATLSTLFLSAIVAPGAKAIRPELLGHPVHPTIHEDVTPTKPVEMKLDLSRKEEAMPVKEEEPATVQPQMEEEPPFDYFEMLYREKYGS